MLKFLILLGYCTVTTVFSSCLSEMSSTYTCIDIANDSVICTDYRGNGSYLNYTTDIDILLLESDVIDYIESNITSDQCREFLMVAVCTIIYPVCTDSGTVQRLCSEECALNENTCAQEVADIIEYINEWLGDPVINFTLNCSNSLEFVELYLESSVCYDDCLSISVVSDSDNSTDNATSVPTNSTIVTAPTTPLSIPDMCIQLDALENAACNGYFRGMHNVILDYTTQENFYDYIETLNNLEPLLSDSGEDNICQNATAYLLCNYVFIPCNLTTGNPRPICTMPCDYYVNRRCANLFEIILRFSSIINYPFMNDCPNTLSHLETFGYSLSSASFADDCIDLAAIVQPGLNLTDVEDELRGDNDMTGGDSDSSGIVIAASVVGSLLALGVVVFFVVLFLLIRHKHKASKYNTSLVTPDKVLYNHNGVQLIEGGDSIRNEVQVADGHTALTADDLELLRKEFGDDFTDLLLPGYQVDLVEVLGEGEFGRVYKGLWTHRSSVDGQEIIEEVAVKTIKNYNSLEKLKAFLLESAVMKDFLHPNVLQVLGISLETEDGLPYILLPFMANGDLKAFLKSKRPEALVVDQFPEDLGEDKLVGICYQIACGMNYLAGKKIVHRDLAARNCMVDDKINVRVADFGLAREVDTSDYYRQQSTGRIPVKWMAPETLNDKISNEKTDVWSYGITCWEIFSLGRTPYPTIPNHEILEYIEAGNRPTKPQLCPNAMYSLMLRCWETDAKCRLCFNEIVTELNKLISCDSGYFVLENESVSHADGYITVNPTKTPNNHYDTHEADLTTLDNHCIDATDTDVITTPDDGTMITDADDTETHDDYTNPTMTHDYINTGIISDDYINPGLNADDYISPIVMRNADTAVAPDNDYVNV